jgi:hypothetical protein
LKSDKDGDTEKPKLGNLDGSLLNKPILINMYRLGDDPLHSVSHELSDQFNCPPPQGDGSVIIYRRGVLNFRNQGDIGSIDASKVCLTCIEFINRIIETLLDNWPALFDEHVIKLVCPWSFV